MNVAIIGVGAMGCLFAGHLASLAKVVMIGRWQEQLAALQDQGLTLIHTDGRESHHRLHATSGLTGLAPADLALILVKSGQTERAARQAQQLLSPRGIALTLQNGLGNLEKVAAVVGANRAALGVTAQGATVVAPGIVRHAGHGPTHLARQPAAAAGLAEVAELFNQAGLETYLTDNANSLVWGKLAVNAGINPLTALLGVPNGFLAENEGARAIMGQAAEEVAAVARAQGIELPFADAAQRALEVARATAANHSSMLQDVMRGASTEIDAICGAVVDYGRRYDVPTPVNERLLQLVKRLETEDWGPEIGDWGLADVPMFHRTSGIGEKAS
ncbi:MAG TPA: 2-dehydropantoate 2-reductase [Anaerolineae bacterium]